MGYWKEETKELTKRFQNEDKVVVIKKLTAGENADMGKACSSMSVSPGVARGSVDMHQGRLVAVHKAIVKADFPHETINDIRAIPGEFFEWLYDEINKFNTVSSAKKAKSGGPSDSEQTTQDLKTT